MSDFNKNDIEKLKQQQLINSILSRNQLETDALIQAVKENSFDVEKRKKEIVNEKLEEQKKENERQIEERQKLLDSVDEELKKWNEEEKQATLKRKETVNQILNEINSKNKKTVKLSEEQQRRARVEKIEREKFRRSFQETNRKKMFLNTQLNILKAKEAREKEQNTSKPTSLNNKTVQTPDVSISKKVVISNSNKMPSSSYITTNATEKSISPFKMLKGVRAYQSTMRFYSQSQAKNALSKILKSINQVTSSNSRNTFIDTLKAKVDHKEALQKSEQQKPRFTPLTL